MGSPTSVDCPIRYVLSFDTGEKCRQALDFSAVAFLKPKLSGVCAAVPASAVPGCTGALVSGGTVSDDADDTSVGTVFRLKRIRRKVRIYRRL